MIFISNLHEALVTGKVLWHNWAHTIQNLRLTGTVSA